MLALFKKLPDELRRERPVSSDIRINYVLTS